ncbi:unnamed protein product [Rangifer tarandus platyrhynchus]|uniref:Uncharacterized protein n=1 Tax=Rangifer tarandus platyrhynchus TaxID=3082113 RepID=A0ABN8Z863_RANTA|nr:unnamed protein product [Rangifer tarandus platyrhynchus]CAI9688443.1 unnamed protein product [Rangifer tarandus platyrhynchus]
MRSKAPHCTYWRPPRGPTISSSQAARRPVTHLEAASRRGPRHLAALLSPQLSTLSDRTQHPPQRVPALYPFKKPDRPGVGVVACAIARARGEEGARVIIGRGRGPAREWRAIT